ncbi:MAG: CoB--CoM heterodisulfide reductase iron-sulfur subunit B family protein [Deltaproteobacteria bacterium]|nr:CoB--CoM heterodisulfide reductase iron-sulfur subunit B family protein [Deltaproteobacteria bacterium]
MKALYYPGCSQKATARGYEESLLAICPEIGLELEELDDWNCCGTTTVVAVNKVLALSLSARNLVLAERRGRVLVTPCPSCWLSLTKAHNLLTDPDGGELARQVRESLAAGGYEYKGTVEIRHLLELLVDEVGPERIQQRAGRPLAGLKVAPYYGCQVVRPYAAGGDDPDDPQHLETLIRATGADVADFALRSSCCGGILVATRPEVCYRMSGEILDAIRRAEANLIVTPCNLCQVTLETVQRKTRKLLGEKMRLPILNITQLVGMAMGIDFDTLGIDRCLVPKRCLREMDKKRAGAQAPAA